MILLYLYCDCNNEGTELCYSGNLKYILLILNVME